MKRNTEPSVEASHPKKGILRRLAGRTAVRAEQASPAVEILGPGTIKRLAETLPKMAAGEKNYMNHAIIEEFGARDRSISGVILVGDSAIAVVRDYPKHRKAHNVKELVKLVQLPFGEHSDGQIRTGKVLQVIDPELLKQPRSDGAVQPWDTITLGRSQVEAIPVSSDADVSRQHVDITVYSDGRIEAVDRSTNGTTAITDRTIYGRAGTNSAELWPLVESLQNNQYSWDTEMTEHTLIADSR